MNRNGTTAQTVVWGASREILDQIFRFTHQEGYKAAFEGCNVM